MIDVTDEQLQRAARIHATKLGAPESSLAEIARQFCVLYRQREAEMMADLYLLSSKARGDDAARS